MIDTTNITVIITGHKVLNYDQYFQYLIHSLEGSLNKSKFIVYYDKTSFEDNDNLDSIVNILKLYNISNYEVKFSQGGLLAMSYHLLKDVKTPYFLFLEHDWVFTKLPNWGKIVNAMNNNKFVKCIKFKKTGNIQRDLFTDRDSKNNIIKLETDPRITECNLISVAYWSNNPFVCTLEQMFEWSKIIHNEDFKKQMDEGNNFAYGPHGLEVELGRQFNLELETELWQDLKDKWGIYIYGNVDMKPIIGHTDGSKRCIGMHYGISEKIGTDWLTKNKNKLKKLLK